MLSDDLPTHPYEQRVMRMAAWYDAPLYQRRGISHPVLLYHPAPHQRDDPDSILGPRPQAFIRPEDLAIYDYGHLHDVQNSGRHVFNGTTFAFHSLRTYPLKISARLGTYYDMLATCGALERELNAVENLFTRLPMRSQLHRTLRPEQAIHSGAGRSAAIGGAVLVVCATPQGYRAILARRNAQAATDPGFYHLVPAFIFQPARPQVQDYEWSFVYHIYREYLEELFGMPESDDPRTAMAEHPAMRDLQARIARETASLHLTGIAINLMTLRPEICTLLLIREPDWYEKASQPGTDIAFNAQAEALGGQLAFVPIETDEALLAALPEEVHTRMPPQATAALWAGVDLARALLSDAGDTPAN